MSEQVKIYERTDSRKTVEDWIAYFKRQEEIHGPYVFFIVERHIVFSDGSNKVEFRVVE